MAATARPKASSIDMGTTTPATAETVQRVRMLAQAGDRDLIVAPQGEVANGGGQPARESQLVAIFGWRLRRPRELQQAL